MISGVFLSANIPTVAPDENDQIGRQMWLSKKGVEIFDWVLRRQILIGSKWMVDRQTDAQIWPALIRQPSQRKGQNTYICKYKYKYKCSNRGLAYKVPIWGCVKSGGVGFCPNRAANLFTTGKSPSPFSGFARAAFQEESASLPWLPGFCHFNPTTQPYGIFLYILKIVFR